MASPMDQLRYLVALIVLVSVTFSTTTDGFQASSLSSTTSSLGTSRQQERLLLSSHSGDVNSDVKSVPSTNAIVTATNDDDVDGTDKDRSGAVMTRRSVFQRTATLLAVSSTVSWASIWSSTIQPANARLEAVDRPDLLPKGDYTNIIQTEKYLTSGQAKRLDTLLSNLERDTGFRVRVLCQQYPNTPGLAIRDYWSLGKDDQKDDKYVVLVVDSFNGRGNALNFNVGDGVKFALPNVFWTRLSGKYGTTFFIKENGMDVAIENAIEAIVSCLRNDDGYCTAPPEQGQSLKSLGMR